MKRARSLGLLTSEKTYALVKMRGGREALGLFLMAEEWCLDQGRDGSLPPHVVTGLPGGFTQKHADVLIASGLWTRAEDVYQFADWPKHHATCAQRVNNAAKTAERVKKHRSKKVEESLTESGVVQLTLAGGNGVTSTLRERSSRARAHGSSSPSEKISKKEKSDPSAAKNVRRLPQRSVENERLVALFNETFVARYQLESRPKDWGAVKLAHDAFVVGGVLDEQAARASITAYFDDPWWTDKGPGHCVDSWMRNATRYLTKAKAREAQIQAASYNPVNYAH